MTEAEVDYSETTQAGAYYYLCPRAAAALPVFKYFGH